MRTKNALATEENTHHELHIRKLEQQLEQVRNEHREDMERLMREGREDTQRKREEFEKELERVEKEGKGEVERARRRGKEEALKMRRQAEELEKTHHQELRVAVERAEMEEQKSVSNPL